MADPLIVARPLLPEQKVSAKTQNGCKEPNACCGLTIIWLFAFFSQFKPSEPFLVDYLVDGKGLSNTQVYQNVFDLFIYARLPCVAIVGLFAELPWCGSRCLLVGGAACGLITVLLTRFGDSLCALQTAQFTVAAAFASRIALPAFALSLTLPSQFQHTVHTIRAVILLSNFCSSMAGELLRDLAGISLNRLFEISAVFQALTLVFAVLLPVRSSKEITPELEVTSETITETIAHSNETDRSSKLAQPFLDLWLSLQLRGVTWWTVWALAMNPAHQLVATNWQNLVRAKHIVSNHNGFLQASMYLVAAVLTAVSGRSASLRSRTSVLVIGSMLVAGILVGQVVGASRQLSIYTWLLLYQCVFEVTTTVATFQVGVEVSRATGVSASRALHGQGAPGAGKKRGFKTAPRCSRLTLVFSATQILCSAVESAIQLLVSGLRSLESRFYGLGGSLAALSAVLAVARCLEAALEKIDAFPCVAGPPCGESSPSKRKPHARAAVRPTGHRASAAAEPLLGDAGERARVAAAPPPPPPPCHESQPMEPP